MKSSIPLKFSYINKMTKIKLVIGDQYDITDHEDKFHDLKMSGTYTYSGIYSQAKHHFLGEKHNLMIPVDLINNRDFYTIVHLSKSATPRSLFSRKGGSRKNYKSTKKTRRRGYSRRVRT